MDKKPNRPQKLKDVVSSLDYNKFHKELSDAQYKLGLLQGSQHELGNARLLISPLTAKEATVSSRIEGTQSTVSDVFLLEAGGVPQNSDTIQVKNYRYAMTFAIDELKKGRKISAYFIKTLHQLLLNGVRHKGRLGEFRKCPVWIAEKEGDPIEKAIYIPPEFHFVIDYIDELISYINTEQEQPLVKAGIAHYQFEAVHPFEDGNGRIGRLLVPLILSNEGVLSEPILYLSGYLDEHRDEYLEALHRVDETGNYESWLSFYLKSVSYQLSSTQKLIERISKLYSDLKNIDKARSPYFVHFLDFIFKVPIFTVPQLRRSIRAATRVTPKKLIDSFIKRGIISERKDRFKRAKLFSFDPLLNMLK